MTDRMPDHVELCVIGGGPAGYAAAFHAAAMGLEVAIVSDEEALGGVCLHRGCIPSKVLLDKAQIIDGARRAAEAGVAFGEPEIDVARLREHTREVVDGLATGLDEVARRDGVHRVRGRARFDGRDRIVVDGSGSLAFDHALIATGSRPAPLPGVEFGGPIMDSSAALELSDIPERLLVVGCGFLGVGLGTLYGRLGSRVTLTEMADQILPGTDGDLVEPLHHALERDLAALHLQTAVEDIEVDAGEVRVSLGGEQAAFDRVLVAIGRRPNSEDLGLEDAGVETDDDGFVVVDDRRRTSAEHVFAAGDVCGGMMLAHEAMHEGRIAAEVAAGHPARFDVRAMPAVVYTEPELAWCGMTERRARQEDVPIEVTRFPWSASGRARTAGAGEGMTKLITDPDSGRVLGVGIVGRGAESLIPEGVLAVEMGAVASDLDLLVHPHPTLSETIGGAARRLLGHPIHLPD